LVSHIASNPSQGGESRRFNQADACYLAHALFALAVITALLGALAFLLSGGRSSPLVWFDGAFAFSLLLGTYATMFWWCLLPPWRRVVDAPIERGEAAGGLFDYSIVIPVYNRPDHLIAITTRIAEFAPSWASLGTGELVIVDDGSQDATAAVADDIVRSFPLCARVIRQRNKGTSPARNTGFREARGTVVISIDSDCIPDSNWLPEMLAAINSQPKTFAFARIHKPAKRPCYPLENIPDVRGIVSASFGGRLSDIIAVGGMCEAFVGSHDDRDFVTKVQEQGYRVLQPDAWISHPMRRESVRSLWRGGLQSRYGNLYAARHGDNARRHLRSGPYNFGGIFGNHLSSLLTVTLAANILAALVITIVAHAWSTLAIALMLAGGIVLVAALAAAALGLRVGARPPDVPKYVIHLFTLQLATCVGRLRGSIEYGAVLL